MGERETIINKLQLTYEGLFSVKELYKLIENWFKERGYDKNEYKNIETVNPDGKYIELEMEPIKTLSDYARIFVRVKLVMNNVKEVEIEKDKRKVRLNQGKVTVLLDGYIVTDYENRWETSPLFFFIRTVADKYIFKPFTSGYRAEVEKEVYQLYDHIKAFLNLYKI